MNLKPVQILLETEMDRREFLAYIGALILAVVGITGLTKALTSPLANSRQQTNNKVGYGGSAYGGVK